MSIKPPIRSSIQRATFCVALGIGLGGCGWLPKPKTDAASFVPHTLDVVQTAAVISDGGIELNPVGWPGVTFVKIGTEVIARQQRNAGHADRCYALALGGRSGGCPPPTGRRAAGRHAPTRPGLARLRHLQRCRRR